MISTVQAARGKKIKTDPPRGRASDLHATAYYIVPVTAVHAEASDHIARIGLFLIFSRLVHVEELCGVGDTGGFLKIAHTKKKILIQIFGPKIQAQN